MSVLTKELEISPSSKVNIYPRENYYLLHKNQRDVIGELDKMMWSEPLCSISFDDVITKTYLLYKLATITEIPVIYLDFDLLYSGYVAAKILPQKQNITLYQPTQNTWKELFANIADEISQRKYLVIIDSLNGFFTMLSEQKDSGRLINSMLVFLSSVGWEAGSVVITGCISKFKKDEGWILTSIGRHVIEINKMSLFSVRKNSGLILESVDHHNSVKKSLQLNELDLL